MAYYPQSILKLIQGLSKLPGIGGKTAERLSLHIMNMPREEAEDIAQRIIDLKNKIQVCTSCYALSDDEKCQICRDPARDHNQVCVVETPGDMVAIEQSGAFKGVYHILCGVLSPMDGIGPKDIRIPELLQRAQNGQITEVVVATGTNVEGEATASYLAEQLQKLNVKVSRIASGIPIGGDLKYIDPVTMKRALDFRYDV